MKYIEKLASIIENEVKSGLSLYNATIAMNIELLCDEIILERMSIIKLYAVKNILPLKDLMYSLNCINLDCASLDKCCENNYSKPVAHAEIPQIMADFGDEGIFYVGSTDKLIKFKVYTNPIMFKNHKYKSRGKDKPFVYIDTTPNKNNMYDMYVFNAPMLERLTVIAIWKDPRQLEEFSCCDTEEMDNITWLNNEIIQNIVKRKFIYYRQYLTLPPINDQTPR